MSNSTASAHPTATTHRKRKPDPARVVQSYWHEVQTRGKRGALRRTGDLYTISDESVRRYLAADEQRAKGTPALPDELAYSPAPGQSTYEAARDQLAAEQRKALTPTAAPADAIRHKQRPQCHRLSHGKRAHVRGIVTSSSAPFERGNVANDRHMPQSMIATRHSSERTPATATAPATPQMSPPRTTALGSAPVKRYAPRPAPRPAHAGIVEWAKENLFAPGPALAVLVFLLLLYLVAVR